MENHSKELAAIIPKGLEYKLISTNDYSYLQKKEEFNEGDEETDKKIKKKNIYMEEGQRMIKSSENKLLTSDVMSSIEKERMSRLLAQGDQSDIKSNNSKKQQRAGKITNI